MNCTKREKCTLSHENDIFKKLCESNKHFTTNEKVRVSKIFR